MVSPVSSQTPPAYYIPWASRAAFPLVSVIFYVTQLVLGISVAKGWIWLTVPLALLASHLMHAYLIAFHEASHGLLRKNRRLNNINGIIMGMVSFLSFTKYRVLHQSHHMHLATEKDVELWPFVKVEAPLWGRRLAAFLELNFGLFYTPFLFWRAFFARSGGFRNAKVRRQIWRELAFMVVFWCVAMTCVIRFELWPWFWWNFFIPAFIAGNLQSWRKYIEHVGLSGNEARSATRSIIADSWCGRFVSLALLHEPLHGIHHIKAGLAHYELPGYTELLEPVDEGDTAPFPNYRTAFVDLLRKLSDPRVGKQWGDVAVAKAVE
ncbi:MAG: fatty acid desaturase [Verrucomicrobiales bacterium]|jgi:fatty acid desaturase